MKQSQSAQQRRSDSRLDEIYREVRDRISLMEYPPGALLSENALAEEFGVSRTPIRQVLQRLEFEGLVESKRGVGTIVTTVDLKSLKEVYALRIKLHEMTGELSPVARVTEGDLAALDTLLERCEDMRTERNPEALARLYHDFQAVAVSAISNTPLREISERLYHQTARVWHNILPDMAWEEEVGYICEEIADVTDALRDDDMQKVGAVRREHLVLLLRRLTQYLGGAGPIHTEPARSDGK